MNHFGDARFQRTFHHISCAVNIHSPVYTWIRLPKRIDIGQVDYTVMAMDGRTQRIRIRNVTADDIYTQSL